MKQQELNIQTNDGVKAVGDYTFEPIRGQPMLKWNGKRSFTATQYFPAQEKERHGDEVNGWMNRIYWGDNLQGARRSWKSSSSAWDTNPT